MSAERKVYCDLCKKEINQWPSGRWSDGAHVVVLVSEMGRDFDSLKGFDDVWFKRRDACQLDLCSNCVRSYVSWGTAGGEDTIGILTNKIGRRFLNMIKKAFKNK